jgi:cell pole-organizing protein PopZ
MSSPQHEPTMEEILASIRKIISEDTPADAPAAANAAPAAPEPDVLELTQEVVETHAPAPADDIIFQDAPAPTPAPAPAPAASNDIFSDRTRQALDDAFASIPEEEEPAPMPAPRMAPAPMPAVDGSTVETVFERAVRESFEPVLQKYLADNSAALVERMKPAIRDWMDQHFPELLHNAVQAEVERVVRSRGRR